MIPRRRRNFYR